MNVSATLFGQMISFLILVWFVGRFLWTPLIRMMDERTKRIADGLAAAEKGRRELELAESRKSEILNEARTQAQEILSTADRRATELVEEAKGHAKHEADRILAGARADIGQELNRAKEQMRTAVAALAVAGAAKIIDREIDAKIHARLLDDLTRQL